MSTQETASQIIARTQAEGNEAAQFALMDSPADLAAVENAVAAGARWSKNEGSYFLHMPVQGGWDVSPLVVIDPSDDTADFGNGINTYRA